MLTRSFWFWMVIFLLELAVVLLFVGSDYARQSTLKEGAWINESLGEETNRVIQRRADYLYKVVVLDTHLEQRLRDAYIPTEEEKARSVGLEALGTREGVWAYVEARIEAFLDMLYWYFRRAALFSIWFPIWIPAFVVACVCGLLERAVKKTDFGYTSPVIVSYAGQGMLLAVLTMGVSFLFPMPVPPVTVPCLLAVAAVLFGLVFGNIQKRV